MIEELNLLNILIGIGSIIIIYFAWKSTNVQDRLPHTAVLVIENNRRRLLENIVRPQIEINHNSSLQNSNTSETQNQNSVNNLISPSAPSLQEVIEEVNDLQTHQRNSNNFHQTFEEEINDLLEEDSDIGPQQIIQDMDNPDTAEGLRRRRLEYYNQSNSNELATERPLRRENLNLQADAQNYSNENNENENLSKNEENQNEIKLPASSLTEPEIDSSVKDEFRIKLKYLNDDLRLVKGCPSEAIGDFKKRHFTVELSSEKMVRLVFNGHVLQPDTKTLQSFGLFDNCVVHCLIHKKPSSSSTPEEPNRISSSTRLLNTDPNRANRRSGTSVLDSNTNGPIFVYLCIAMVSLAIIFCWYCRIQYSSLFSLYSTVGLVLITALFLIIFPLVVLIERDVST